jgi:glycosyltransferase involved in cell wall biosynthesis
MHLAGLRFTETWEVVLVDNNSTDDTQSVAAKTWTQLQSPSQLRMIFESKPGLSFARSTGVLSSHGELIVFCDDDNWLAPDFLSVAAEAMKNAPNMGAVGGCGYPVTELSEFPPWFFTYANAYAVGSQSINAKDIVNARGYLFGAGLVLRGDWLRGCYSNGIYSLLTDRAGTRLSAGGDSEICKWVRLAGYDLAYREDLRFQHFIPENRLQKDYLTGLLQGFSESRKALEEYDHLLFIRQLERKTGKSLLLAKSLMRSVMGNESSRRTLRYTLPSKIAARTSTTATILKNESVAINQRRSS